MTMFKHYIPKAILLSVHYTGTHFVRELLSHLDKNIYIPNAHWSDSVVDDEWNKIILRKVIVTVRDPYLSAIRYLKMNSANPVLDAANEWDKMLNSLDQLDHFIFNVECDNRLKHANELFNFIGFQPRVSIEPFVEKWLPVNQSTSTHKMRYLESGELPEGYDWSALQPAVDWYKQLTATP